MGLVHKYPVFQLGHKTFLNIFHKFVLSHDHINTIVETEKTVSLRSSIVSLTKASPYGTCLLQDLHTKLGISNIFTAKVNFVSVVRKLAAQGYIEVYHAISPNRGQRYYCVKYHKELPENDDFDECGFNYELNDMFNDLAEEGHLKSGSSTDFVPPDLKILINSVESQSTYRARILFNQHYPMVCQIFQFVASTGTKGALHESIIDSVSGSTYSHPVTRCLELICDNSIAGSRHLTNASKSPLGYLGLIRGMEQINKAKRKKYFSNQAYVIMNNAETHLNWGQFRLISGKRDKTLVLLEKKYATPLPACPSVLGFNGHPLVQEHSDQKKSSETFSKSSHTKANLPAVVTQIQASHRNELQSDSSLSEIHKTNTEFAVPNIRKRSLISGSLPESLKRQRKLSFSISELEVIDISSSSRETTPAGDDDSFYSMNRERINVKQQSIDSFFSSSGVVRTSASNDAPATLRAKRARARLLYSEIPDSDLAVKIESNPPVSTTVIKNVSTQQPSIINRQAIPKDDNNTDSSYVPQEEESNDNTSSEHEKSIPQEEEANESTLPHHDESEGDSIFDAVPGLPHFVSRGSASENRLKQNLQVLKLLLGNDGVICNNTLLSTLNKEATEKDVTMGKRPFGKAVKRLERQGIVRHIFVTIPHTNGELHTTRSILIHKSVGDDDPKIVEVKNKLIRDIRTESDIKARRRLNSKKRLKENIGEGEKLSNQVEKKKQQEEPTEQNNRIGTEKEQEVTKPQNVRQKKKQTSRKHPNKGLTHEITAIDPSTRLASLTPAENEKKKADKPEGSNVHINYDRFFRIVIIARSLFGGMLSIINWDKVAEAIPGMTPRYAKLLWPRVQKVFAGDNIDLIMKTWEKIFLQAYEDGEIAIFKDELYDLQLLAQFWKEKAPEISGFHGVPLLYEGYEENESRYMFKPLQVKLVHDIVFSTTSNFEIGKALVNWSMAAPKPFTKPEETQVSKAKTAIKAIIATSKVSYSPARAKEILNTFGEQVCVEAIQELEKERAIVYIPRARDKIIPDRNFAFSEKFMLALSPWLGEDAFLEMTEFYQELLDTLNESKGYIMSRGAPDYSLVCVLDLLCHEKTDLIRVVISGTKAETDKIKNTQLDSDVAVRTPIRNIGSETHEVIEEVKRSKKRSVPLGEACSTMWTDVRGRASRSMWQRLVYWMLMHIESRPGVTIAAIYTQIRFVISWQEVAILVKWLVKKNIVRRGPCEGYWVLPEWYAHIPL